MYHTRKFRIDKEWGLDDMVDGGPERSLAVELLHKPGVALGYGEVVIMNQCTVDTDGLRILDAHVLLEAGNNLLQGHFVDGVFGCGIEMSLVNAFGK